MEVLFNALARSKFSSIVIMGLFMGTGVYLIKDQPMSLTPSVVGGSVCLVVGIICGIFSYADHRSKEHTDKLLQYYKDALADISKTHSAFESKTQTDLTTGLNDQPLSGGYRAQTGIGTRDLLNS